MIDVSQWRAAIGHWNSSRLRFLTLATDIDAESLRESTNKTFNAASTIKPTNNPTATYTAAVTHISAVCSGPDSTPNRTAEVSTKETVPICRRMLSYNTVSYAVYLLLYLMLLLLLSGDIELNPGPVTVEQVCTHINGSLQEHFASIEKATKHCISDISSELFSKDLISDAVKDSPTYGKIYDEFKAGLSSVTDLSQLIERYETFLECLSCDGGPAKDAVDSLTADWKEIKKQCEEGYSYEFSSLKTNPSSSRFVSGKLMLALEHAEEKALWESHIKRQNYTQIPPLGDHDELLEINSKWLKDGMRNSTIKVKVMPMLLINCGLPSSSKTTALKKLLQDLTNLKEEDSIGFCDMLAAQNVLDNKIVFTPQLQDRGYSYVMYTGVESIARLAGKRMRVSLSNFSGFSNEDLSKHLIEVMMDLLENDLKKESYKFTEWNQSYTCGLALINVWDLGLNKILTYILSHLTGHLYNSHVWMFLDLLRDVDHLYEVPDIPENRYDKSRNDKLIMRWRSRIHYFVRFAKLASMKNGNRKRVCSVIASYNGSTDLEEKMGKLKDAVSNVSKQLQLQDLIDMENFEVFHNEDIDPLYHLLQKRIKDGLEYHAKEVPLSFMFLRSFFYKKNQLYIMKDELEALSKELNMDDEKFQEFCCFFTSFGSIIDVSLIDPSSKLIILQPVSFLNELDKLFYYSSGDPIVTSHGLVSKATAKTIFNQDASIFMSFLESLRIATKILPGQVNIPIDQCSYYISNVCTHPPLLQCSPTSLHLVYDMNNSLSHFLITFTANFLESYPMAQLDVSRTPHINVTRFCSHSNDPLFELVYLGDIIEFRFPDLDKKLLHKVCEHVIIRCHEIMHKSDILYNFAIMCAKNEKLKSSCNLQMECHALPLKDKCKECSVAISSKDVERIEVFNSILAKHKIAERKILNMGYYQESSPLERINNALYLANRQLQAKEQHIQKMMANNEKLKKDAAQLLEEKAQIFDIITDNDKERKANFAVNELPVIETLKEKLQDTELMISKHLEEETLIIELVTENDKEIKAKYAANEISLFEMVNEEMKKRKIIIKDLEKKLQERDMIIAKIKKQVKSVKDNEVQFDYLIPSMEEETLIIELVTENDKEIKAKYAANEISLFEMVNEEMKKRKIIIKDLEKKLQERDMIIAKIKKQVKPVKDNEVQFDYLIPSMDNLNSLSDVQIAEKKLFFIQGDKPQLINWEKFGLRIGIEECSLSPSQTVEVAVIALVGGQFQFPPNTVLVSAVYAVSLSKPLLKQLILEIQHCVDLSRKPALSRYLKFAIAPLSTPSLSYQFSIVEGGEFSSNSWYGSIQRKEFCLVCILGEELTNGGGNGHSDSEDEEDDSPSFSHSLDSSNGSSGPTGASNKPQECTGEGEKMEEKKVDELGKEEQDDNELVHSSGIKKDMKYYGIFYFEEDGEEELFTFTAAKKLNVLIEFIKNEHSHAKMRQNHSFCFKDNDGYVELKFDAPQEEPITGWNIKPHIKPCKLYRFDLNNFGEIGYPIPPYCLISVYKSPNAVPTLHYAIPLEGVTDPVTLYIHSSSKNPSSSVPATAASENSPGNEGGGGGINVKDVRNKLKKVLITHHVVLSEIFQYSLVPIANELFQAGIITQEVQKTPTYNSMIGSFTSGMSLFYTYSELEKHCIKFLKALSNVGGPVNEAAYMIQKDWTKASYNVLLFEF